MPERGLAAKRGLRGVRNERAGPMRSMGSASVAARRREGSMPERGLAAKRGPRAPRRLSTRAC
jgi:hypothetical protein